LRWKRIEDAELYIVEISTDPGFTSVAERFEDTETKFGFLGNKNEIYYLRMRVKNTAGVLSPWQYMGTISFTSNFPKIFGGISDDYANSIIKTTDNGYIFCGASSSYPGGGLWVVKMNGNGDSVWSKTFSEGNNAVASTITQTSDGGYIIAGYNNNGNENALILKIDGTGNKLWSKVYGGNGDDIFRSAVSTPDGGCIGVGYTFSNSAGGGDGWIVRLNSIGDTVWTKKYGSSGDEGLTSVNVLENGICIITGYAFRSVEYDAWLLKIDDQGNQLFSKYYGTPTREWTGSLSIGKDRNFVLGGQTYSRDGSSDIYIIKTDSSGNLLWTKTIGNSGYDLARFSAQDDFGNIFIAGYGDFSDKMSEAMFVKLDQNGNILFTKTYGGNFAENIYSGCMVNQGIFVLAGLTSSYGPSGNNAYIIRLNSEGISF